MAKPKISDIDEEFSEAVEEGSVDELRTLIARGVSKDALTQAMDSALGNNHFEKVLLFLDSGAAIDADHNALLLTVMENNQHTLLAQLLEKHTKAVYDNVLQFSHFALEKGSMDCLATLATCPNASTAMKRHFRDKLEEAVGSAILDDEDLRSSIAERGAGKSDLGKTIPNPEKVSPDGQRDRYASYVHVMSMAQAVTSDLKLGDKELLHLVRNTPGDWETISEQLQQFTYQDAKNVKDMMKEVTQYLVVPAFFAHLPDETWKTNLWVESFNGFTGRLTPLVAQMLLPQQNLTSLLELSRTWHNRRTGILSAVRDTPLPGSWHALMEPREIAITGNKTLEGWTVCNLTNASELEIEGQHTIGKMGTCIDGFSSDCLSGRQHVFIFRDKRNHSIAYIRAEISDDEPDEEHIKLQNGKFLEVLYHTGPENSPPSPAAKAAYDWFKTEVEAGNISIQTSQVGQTSDSKKVTTPDLVGFDPLKPGKLQQVFDILAAREGNPVGQILRVTKERQLIPSEYRHLGVGDFMNRPLTFSMSDGRYGDYKHYEFKGSLVDAIRHLLFRDSAKGGYHNDRYELAEYIGVKKDDELKFRAKAPTRAATGS